MPPNSLRGIPTGFTDLDLLTGGLIGGRLMVIASRPGLGRSTLVTDMCRHAAIKHKVPTLAYTLEESREHFVTRVLSAEARVARLRIHAGTTEEAEWTRLGRIAPVISDAPLWIKAPSRLTMRQLEDEATELVQDHGVRLIAVDGIQDIRPAKRSDLREREVGDIVRDLKTLARELEVPIIATSHLNRSPEQQWDKKPMLDDLRESGVITVAFQGHYGRFVDMAQN
ncbi:replicative DNA helicase [Streptomyces griseosporeus]|uniref:replicative DNA helicase n=1 Tax=Streptomyces griseosporeus TaxID=1910 RepID=UPI0037A629FA